jgi:hypothetical protein
VAGDNPQHASVHWDETVRTAAGEQVRVTCPQCDTDRFVSARMVRHKVSTGQFTALCRADAARLARSVPLEPPHSAIDWSSITTTRPPTVTVRCPICLNRRAVVASSVRKQLRAGTFTGRCVADRTLGKPRIEVRPQHPLVDWSDIEVVVDGGDVGARRTMVRVRCPLCPTITLFNPAYLTRLLEQGVFRAECNRHRLRLKPRHSVNPPHPAVNWRSLTTTAGVAKVTVTCPVCHESRVLRAADVRQQIKGGRFTGRCLRDGAQGMPV